MAPRLGAQRTAEVSIRAPLARGDLPGLFSRVCALLEEDAPELLICDVTGVAADAVAVDALARLQLAARRRACRVSLRHGSSDLRALVVFMGLREVLFE